MELTAIAQWLNTAFAGYDYTILQALHSLAGTAGGVFWHQWGWNGIGLFIGSLLAAALLVALHLSKLPPKSG